MTELESDIPVDSLIHHIVGVGVVDRSHHMQVEGMAKDILNNHFEVCHGSQFSISPLVSHMGGKGGGLTDIVGLVVGSLVVEVGDGDHHTAERAGHSWERVEDSHAAVLVLENMT